MPDALRPGGVLAFEALTVDHLRFAPAFRRESCLECGEVHRLFPELDPVRVQERDDGRSAAGRYLGRRACCGSTAGRDLWQPWTPLGLGVP